MNFILNVRKTEEDGFIVYKSVIAAVSGGKTQASHVLFITLQSIGSNYFEELNDENAENVDNLFAFMHKYNVEIHAGKECEYFYFYTDKIPDRAFSAEISQFHPTPIYLALDKIAQNESFSENEKQSRQQANYYWPQVSPSSGENERDFFERILHEGLIHRYGKVTPTILARANQKKTFIIQQGLQSYFLIWHDILQHVKSIGGEFGPGRGSAVGSLVCYALGITKVDPIKHGLLFERFINDLHPIPAISVDAESDRRDEIFAYIQEKYGAEFVAKMSVYRTGKDGVQVKGVNAADVVISDTPIRTLISASWDDEGWLVTNLGARECEKLGLLKLGILGLRDVTALKNSMKLIREKHPTFDLEKINYDDKQTLDEINNHELVGVFCLEGETIRETIRQVQPNCFNDIVAIIALPGTTSTSAVASDYIANKNNPEKICYLHPLLRSILEETYGVLMYQEQMMRILCEIGGFDMTAANHLRRILKSGQYDEIDLNRQKFVSTAEKLGVTGETAQKILNCIFLRNPILFNKSHAVAYAVLAFQMAYISVHYPKEFCLGWLEISRLSEEDRAMYEFKLKQSEAK